MTGAAIYASFMNSDFNRLAENYFSIADVAGNYDARTASLVRLTTLMEGAWQGEAAGVASRGGGPLVTNHMVAVTQFANTKESISLQNAAFQAAKNSVVPVPAMPEAPGLFDNVTNLDSAAAKDYERQVAAAQNANDHNIAVMAQYEENTRANQAMLSEIPTVLNPPVDGGQTPQPLNSPAQSPTQGPAPAFGASGVSGHGGWSPGAAATTTPNAQPAPRPANTEPPRQTHANAVRTPAPHVSVETGAPKPTPVPEGPRPGQTFGPTGGAYRPGPHSGFGPGTDNPRGGSRGGTGGRGPAVLESAAGKGAMGRAGAPGSGVPLSGGTRSQAAEDAERQRPSFLAEADPDEIFGSDEAVAPPVIGA